MSNSSVASQTLLPVSDDEALGLYARKDPRELYRRAEQMVLAMSRKICGDHLLFSRMHSG